jgi:hypothetical protein
MRLSNVIACVPFLSVKHILLVDIYTDLLQLTENDYLDICLQSIYMKIKNVNWIILIIISLDYAYDITIHFFISFLFHFLYLFIVYVT